MYGDGRTLRTWLCILILVLMIPSAIYVVLAGAGIREQDMRGYYAGILMVLLLIFSQISSFYFLSLAFTGKDGCPNPPHIYIPSAVLISFHTSVSMCILWLLSFFLFYDPHIISMFWCCYFVFIYIFTTPIFLYVFSAEFLKISYEEAVKVSIRTSVGMLVSGFLLMHALYLTHSLEMLFVYFMAVFVPLSAVMFGLMTLRYIRMHREWLESGRTASPERLVTLGHLLILLIPAIAMLIAIFVCAWFVFRG